MSQPNDYTVGWICAVSTEYLAAQAFLDEKHKNPEHISPNDNNDYTLGKMGEHNVVIAVLPDGQYGMVSAAIVARDMLHSFPNIRIGLSVGIGGGAPSLKHDIRLGDIVVGSPRDGKAGVFQYDFGKTTQDQGFQYMGFLNQPPAILRSALNTIRSEYRHEGHQIQEAINKIIEKRPRLQKKYGRPHPSSDRLYQSGVVHPVDDDSSCVAACGADPSKLILRSERTQDEDNPTIHYGVIASGNQLIKDALFRDRLAAEEDILCFEMEAAGLVNHFPCLAIRGICDYADSHRNRQWQGYAALAAAAFAKDLLRVIPPQGISNIDTVAHALAAGGVRDAIQGLRDILTERPLQRDRPSPAAGDFYNTWLLDIWKQTPTIDSVHPERRLSSKFNTSYITLPPPDDPSSSQDKAVSHGSRTLRTADPLLVEPVTTDQLGTEGDLLTEYISTDSDDSDLISLIYDKLPKSVSEQGRNFFHVVVRRYKSDSPTWSQRPCSLFRDPILSEVGILLGIPSGFASVARVSDGGSCIPFGNDQTRGYIIQTPFYNKFEGFWSLSIKWSKANAKDLGTQCSQALAILETTGDLPRKILLDVHRLSRAYQHPVYLLTRLLEQHIEDSVVKFENITGRIAEIERTLREDLSRPQNLSYVDKTLQTHRRLNAALHNCSIDVVDLEKRRHFEKGMSSHVNKLVASILEGYDIDKQPPACVDLKQRMGLFSQVAESRDLDITSLPRRISTQMNVLYNQIAQRDAWVNLDIAKAARDDNVVLVQDSNAMKTIAVLTTLFLPGTFIAALMSTSMFSFADNEIYLSNKFWLYWALAVPLTVIVVTGLLAWMHVIKRRFEKRKENSSQQGADVESGSVQTLIAPRRWRIWKMGKKSE